VHVIEIAAKIPAESTAGICCEKEILAIVSPLEIPETGAGLRPFLDIVPVVKPLEILDSVGLV
jgi:hypothetical protein